MTSNLGAAALLKAADEGDFDNSEVKDGEEESEEFQDAWEDAKEQVVAEPRVSPATLQYGFHISSTAAR